MKPINKMLFITVFVMMTVMLLGTIEPRPAMAEGTVSEWLDQQSKHPAKPAAKTENNKLTTNTDVAAGDGGSTSLFFVLVKLLFYTALVLVMIYGLIRFLAKRQKKLQHHQLFKTLGGAPLGNNKSLQMVKAGGKIYLLGVGNEVTLIKEITDPVEMMVIEQEAEEQQQSASSLPVDVMTYIQEKRKQFLQGSERPSFQQLLQQSAARQRDKWREWEQRRRSTNDGQEGNDDD